MFCLVEAVRTKKKIFATWVDFKDLSVFARKSSNIGPIGPKIGT
jgi:hypothetical protein